MLTTPGVKMETPGVPDETERVNLIAYLRTLSDKPIPLPLNPCPSPEAAVAGLRPASMSAEFCMQVTWGGMPTPR